MANVANAGPAVLLVALAGLLPPQAGAVEGAMRPDQPQVLAPPVREAVAVATPWQSLRPRLARRNRVMLFWQSELEDSVSTGYREVETSDVRAHGVAARVDGVVGTYSGPAGVTVAGGEGHLHSTTERYVAADGHPQRRATGELRMMESEFMAELRHGGVRFIDRTLATRLTGKNVEGERPNLQGIETRALVGHADYLMQVNAVADGSTGSGRMFHVVLLDVSSGESVLDFHTPADPAGPGPGAYAPTGDGFARVEAGVVDAGAAARELARETGRQMAAALAGR